MRIEFTVLDPVPAPFPPAKHLRWKLAPSCNLSAPSYQSFSSENDSAPLIDSFGDNTLSSDFFADLANERYHVEKRALREATAVKFFAKRADNLSKEKKDIGIFGYGKAALPSLYAFITYPNVYKTAVISLCESSKEQLNTYRGLMQFYSHLDQEKMGKILLIHHTNIPKTLMNTLLKLDIDFDVIVIDQKADLSDSNVKAKIAAHFTQTLRQDIANDHLLV